MPKYKSNAGFKNYEPTSNDDTANGDIVARSTPKWKSTVILVGVVITVLFLIIAAMVCLMSDETPSEDESATTQPIAETLDYDELFKTAETTISDEGKNFSFSSSEHSSNSEEKFETKAAETKNTSESSDSKHNVSSQNSSSNKEKTNNNSSSQVSNNTNNNSNNYSYNEPKQSNNGNQNNNNTDYNSNSNNKVIDNTPKTVEVNSVSISSSNITITVGKATTLSASVSPSNASNKSITWSSGNNSIVAVNQGRVTALSVGSTQIYAISNNGIKATCNVTVKDKPEEVDNVSITPEFKTIKIGQTVTIEIKGANKCTWNISNPFVVKEVSKQNTKITVKGAKKGITNIEAVLPNGKSYKAKITVQ